MTGSEGTVRAKGDSHAPWTWLTAVLGGWSLVHLVNSNLGWVTDAKEPASALAFWTFAKFLVWLVPTFALIHSWPVRDLGVRTTAGCFSGLLVSAFWAALQETGAHFHWPAFGHAPAELVSWRLIGSLLVAPLFEEFMFRGALLRGMRERNVSVPHAVLINALAFAALHMPGWIAHRGTDITILGSFASIALFGAVAATLACRARSLWAPVLLHIVNNLVSTGVLDGLIGSLRS